MTDGSTQAILTLFIGETYLEAALFDQVDLFGNQKSKSSANRSSKLLWGRQFYLPHTSLKSALTQISKEITESKWSVTNLYLVTRYLERLQNFRLGGSVAQYVPEGFEGHVFFSNSIATSIVNPSLVIAKSSYDLSLEAMQNDLEKLKKINSECDKIVIHTRSIGFAETDAIHKFFKDNGFTTFSADLNAPSAESRKSLFSAGVYGTISELFSELKTLTPNAQVWTWFEGKWNPYDESAFLMEKGVSLYFSGQDFLWNHLAQDRSSGDFSTLAHFDFDHWEQFQNDTCEVWQSPWGPIKYRSQYRQSALPISPKHEVVLDETGRLQIQKPSTSNESGPLLAGRSNRLTALDLFADLVLENDQLHKMVGSPDRTQVLQKTWAQFSALEKAQNRTASELTSSKLKNFIRSIIQVHTSGGILRTGQVSQQVGICGQLDYLFEAQGVRLGTKKAQPSSSRFFWSDAVLDSLKKSQSTSGVMS